MVKKNSVVPENFQELRPEFPGTDGERQTLPERENQKRKGKHL
jgi:hypothetical protein